MWLELNIRYYETVNLNKGVAAESRLTNIDQHNDLIVCEMDSSQNIPSELNTNLSRYPQNLTYYEI